MGVFRKKGEGVFLETGGEEGGVFKKRGGCFLEKKEEGVFLEKGRVGVFRKR